jgi:hypothetical protein
MFKAARRVLDSLRDPAIVAVGLVDAAWSGSNWKVGVTALVLTSRGAVDLRRAFDRTKDIVRPFDIEAAFKPYGRLKQLLRGGQQAKVWLEGRTLLKPGPSREYYRWLSRLQPRVRLFRYGVDRHFNKLVKAERRVKRREPRRHPTPYWLESYQYGSHPDSCGCNICRS